MLRLSDEEVQSALVTSNERLRSFCQRSAESDFLCIDTEFLTGKTYWAQLCLIQVASEAEAIIVDPLAAGLDLQELFILLDRPSIVKVFHSAYHDIELLYRTAAKYGGSFVPLPLFDSQVAAMACGCQGNMSLKDLVARVTGHKINKSKTIRNSDWSRRELSTEQLRYALGDVVYLRLLYLELKSYLQEHQRESWLEDEWKKMAEPTRYQIVKPDEAWKNVRGWDHRHPLFMALLQKIAAWREDRGQTLDIARHLMLSDELLVSMARTIADDPHLFVDDQRCHQLFRDLLGESNTNYRYLFFNRRAEPAGRSAAFQQELAEIIGQTLLQVQQSGLPESPPLPPAGRQRLRSKSMCSLLQTLLEIKCEMWEVAPSLIATAAELQMLAADSRAQIPALSGWRYEVFGSEAVALKEGRVGIGIRRNKVCLLQTIELPENQPKDTNSPDSGSPDSGSLDVPDSTDADVPPTGVQPINLSAAGTP